MFNSIVLINFGTKYEVVTLCRAFHLFTTTLVYSVVLDHAHTKSSLEIIFLQKKRRYLAINNVKFRIAPHNNALTYM